MKNLLIRGGRLATASDVFEADLLARDGRIAAIGTGLNREGAEEIDARGLLVLPGGIDTHVHLAHPIDRLGIETADDFDSGTRAAAFGGTTTIVDFALQRKGESILEVARRRRDLAAPDARVDFGLHIIVTDVRDDVIAEIPQAIAEGFTSFKVYLTYSDKYVDDGGLIRVLEATKRHGGIAYVHCENHFAAQHLIGSWMRPSPSPTSPLARRSASLKRRDTKARAPGAKPARSI
jgi:dihydropyrimidinase